MSYDRKKVNIVIIDSGISCHKDINISINGVSIQLENEQIIYNSNVTDNIGHGTAITSLIIKNIPEASIFSIKIYEDEYCKPELLEEALKYVYMNIECDIVNISLGTIFSTDIGSLQDICEKLTQKGVVIVSAFDNNGTISYPAAFENVIGVDVSMRVGSVFDYDYIENSPVNIRGYYREQRLPWVNDTYEIVSGASFVAPYITILISKYIQQGYTEIEKIKKLLKENAKEIISCIIPQKHNPFKIDRAITFPFNK